MQSHLGEIAALATACCWTVTALAFEASGKRVGSLVVNLIRLCLGFAFLSLYTLIFRGRLLPLDATPHAWFWLSLSGVVGFFFGDLFQSWLNRYCRLRSFSRLHPLNFCLHSPKLAEQIIHNFATFGVCWCWLSYKDVKTANGPVQELD